MNIPSLQRSGDISQYKKHELDEIQRVVYAWLFTNKSHRKIDEEILHLTAKKSLGFPSMSVLHYLGLKKEFHNLFNGMEINDAISQLRNAGDDYSEVISILSRAQEIDTTQIREDILTESETEHAVMAEGREVRYFTTRYERQPVLRKEAVRLHGTRCMACGFDFEEVYGTRGKDYIEVHHIEPLATRDAVVEVDPAKDLIVVCANCHRIIHRKRNEVLALVDLQQIILDNK